VAGLKELALEIREDQVHPLPFYQARIIWNNPEQELKNLKLSAAWINNLKQQQVYTFRVAAENNQSCTLLAETIRKTPEQFVESLQLQFTVSAASIESKVLNVKSEHVASSQLAASLKNLPGVTGTDRYLTSDDYNRLLWQISNQVLASEVTSGDYVDADDEVSLKDVIAQMFQTQKENTAQFDDKMWNSVFWDPLDSRPDQITSELNKLIYINESDHRAYLTKSDTESAAAQATIMDIFGGSGSESSASSMTTDELTHKLLINNVMSEVHGNKFVPKKLDLVRMNVNDLSRHDVLTTKRVRVKQVQIGGALQIGIGNSSRDAAEDENRYLRQQLADIQKSVQLQNANLTGLQQSVNGLQTSANGLRADVGTLQQQAKNIHTYDCQVIQYPYPSNCGQCSLAFSCPEGKFARDYDVYWVEGCNHYARRSVTCC